jgi:hypothetical protein
MRGYLIFVEPADPVSVNELGDDVMVTLIGTVTGSAITRNDHGLMAQSAGGTRWS